MRVCLRAPVERIFPVDNNRMERIIKRGMEEDGDGTAGRVKANLSGACQGSTEASHLQEILQQISKAPYQDRSCARTTSTNFVFTHISISSSAALLWQSRNLDLALWLVQYGGLCWLLAVVRSAGQGFCCWRPKIKLHYLGSRSIGA